MEFSEYQRRAAETDLRDDPDDIAFPLLGLAGEVGSLVAEYKKHLRAHTPREEFIQEAREDLGDLLWYLAALSRTLHLPLEDVARDNLDKIIAAWGDELPPSVLYDEEFPETQRLPRSFRVQFNTYQVDGLEHVVMFDGTRPIGDPLNDNAYDHDDYRFHDAFHLACAAVLGWSPIMRHFWGKKRKQDNEIDRVEDGARARAIEEALSAYIFSVGSRHCFFRGAQRVDWELLKTVRRMTEHLEVKDQPPLAWQQTILQAYDVWNALSENKGGIVEGSLKERRLTYISNRAVHAL